MNLPIIDYLLKLDEKKGTSFHVPGHKNGSFFKKHDYKNFFEKLGAIDTTEIFGTDNLHEPKGIIKDSQERASNAFKSKETFFLVNGSTSGIYSMIMATTSPGDKLIVNRNCHKSVVQGCILADVTPIYVYPEIDKTKGIALGVSPEEIEKHILQNMDCKGVIITYPTYEGIASNLKKISEIVHKYDKILLVDEAHGAHLGLSDFLPKTALDCGADIVVQSIHKTLPALTQSSMIHIQGSKVDIEKLKYMLQVHQSSSPSYILMGSLEFAIMIYDTVGQKLMEKLLLNIKEFRKEISNLKHIDHLNSLDEHRDKYTVDPTKLYIYSKNSRFTGVWLETYLRKNYNIQMELSNIYGALGVTTIANEKEDFERLLEALVSLEKLDFKGEQCLSKFQNYPLLEQKITPREGIYRGKRKVELKESIGLISGEFIIPYPPGIPLVAPGEVITEEVIEYMLIATKAGIDIIGMKDKTFNYIEVII